MYLMFKIKIFKMQLLKNYTANPVNSTCSLSICSPSFSENCPTRGVFSKKINVKKNLMLIGRQSRSFFCDWHLSNLDSICKAIKNIQTLSNKTQSLVQILLKIFTILNTFSCFSTIFC